MISSQPKARISPLTQLFAHLRVPLYRNGYALMIGSATTSALGVAYWALAARYYPPEIVGVSSAVLSAMMLLAGIAVLSLPGALVRFIPQAGDRTRSFVLTTYVISVGTAAILSSIFCLTAGRWSEQLAFLQEDRMWFGAFVLATVAWCIFSLQDSALTGLRQAIWVPVENTLFSVAKIGLLLLLAGPIPQWGLFTAWTIPVIIALAPINYLLFQRWIPQHSAQAQTSAGALQATGSAGFTYGAVQRYVIGNYPGTLLYLAYTMLLPLLVTHIAGSRANAYFFIPWMIASGLQLIALNLTTSLTVEAARDEAKLALYCYRILQQSLKLLLPLILLVSFAAPWILLVFGTDYRDAGTALLQLLALSSIPNAVVMLYLSFVRIQNRVGGVIFTQGALCILLLGLSYVLLPQWGITGIGWASL
ncbi:MAG: hypothetical protein KDE19_04110, partial [Caldilineaceae bacterium]|nr:hypothetical protein [Caldilineaceae bacterium]